MVSSWPGVNTWVGGDIITAAELNQYNRDTELWSAVDRPRVEVQRTEAQAEQTISNATVTSITWGETTYETPGTWWTSGTSLAVPVDGFYLIKGNVRWEGNSVGYRQARINVDGSFRQVNTMVASTATSYHQVVVYEELNASQVIDLAVYQNSGTDLDVGNSVGSRHSLSLNVVYMCEKTA